MSTATPSKRLETWLGFATFVYGTALGFVFTFFVYWRQGLVAAAVDLNGYGVIARNIAHGIGFSLGYGPTIRRGPFYPFFAAGLLKLFGDRREGIPDLVAFRPVLLANCLLVGASCFVVFRIARSVFGLRTALLAAALCPLVPQTMRYVGMAEVETLMGLFTLLLAWTGLNFAARPAAWTALAFGATAAGAALTKPVVLFYPFLFVMFALLHWRKARVPRRQALLWSFVALSCFVALLLPWTLRNFAVTDGHFKGICSNGPGEFLRGYINAQPKYYLLRQDFGGTQPRVEKWDPEASAFEERILRAHGQPLYRYNWVDGKYLVIPPPPSGTSTASVEADKDRIEGAEMKRRLLHEPLNFVRKFLIQLLTFWYVVETRRKSVFVGAIALALLGLAAVGVFHARQRGALVWPVVAVILYNNAFYAAVLAFARYSMPLFPTLILLSAGGLAFLGERLFGGRAVSAARGGDPA